MSSVNNSHNSEINSICLFSENYQDPCSHIRILGPMDHLNIEVIQGFKDGILNLDGISECDLVVIQRIFPRHLDLYERVIQKAREEKKRVIFDLDDFLFALPDNHPERINHVYTSALLPMMRAAMEADIVTVSTDKLREMLLDINSNTVVIPNYLDDKLWRLNPPKPIGNEGTPIVIGYMGSTSHEPDLKIITSALSTLLEKFPNKLRYHFWGIRPPDELEFLSQVSWTPAKTYNYSSFSDYFQKQRADIFVAPIVDNLFNRCKSGIKFLEYTTLGAAGVFSNLEPYNSIITHGHDGFLANSEQEWIEYLSDLIENDQLRIKIAAQAQDTIKSKWLLSNNCSKWITTQQSTQKNISSKWETSSTNKSKIIRELSRQLFEDDYAKNETIFNLASQIKKSDKLQSALDECENEVVQYIQSFSWKLTRPLRKFAKLLGK